MHLWEVCVIFYLKWCIFEKKKPKWSNFTRCATLLTSASFFVFLRFNECVSIFELSICKILMFQDNKKFWNLPYKPYLCKMFCFMLLANSSIYLWETKINFLDWFNVGKKCLARKMPKRCFFFLLLLCVEKTVWCRWMLKRAFKKILVKYYVLSYHFLYLYNFLEISHLNLLQLIICVSLNFFTCNTKNEFHKNFRFIRATLSGNLIMFV